MPEPIFEPGPVATPFVYTVSGTGEVVPRACQAVYDGSGAGGDYIPAVIFRSQAGHVIARAILQSTVTAGDDAEVSWFPGVKAAAAVAPSGGIAYSRGYWNTFIGDPAIPISGGGVRNPLPFAHIDADPTGAITWTTTTTTNDTANLNSAGIYTVTGSVHMNTAASGQEILIKGVNTLAEQLSQLPWKSMYAGGEADGLGVATQQAITVYRVTSAPVTISLLAFSNAGVSLNFGYFVVLYNGAV